MPPRPLHLRLARLVLAWFVAYLAIAGVAPWVHAQAADEICTPFASAQSAPSGKSLPGKGHTLQCPQCIGVAGPPAEVAVLLPAAAPLGHALLPLVAAHIAGITGAPLPARGPPTFS